MRNDFGTFIRKMMSASIVISNSKSQNAFEKPYLDKVRTSVLISSEKLFLQSNQLSVVSNLSSIKILLKLIFCLAENVSLQT